MKKLLPVVLVVAVVAVGAYFFLGKGKTPGLTIPGKEEVFEGSLAVAVQKGVPLKCEWNQDNANYGTTWVKGQNVYAEVTTGGKMGYMVAKDNCAWTWDSSKKGVKVCSEEVNYDELTNTTPVTNETAEGSAGSMPSYKCSPAVIQDSRFEVPSDVSITDMQEMMQQFGGGQ